MSKIDEFKKDLTELINKHSMEGRSNTPDFILAEFLVQSLLAFNRTSQEKDRWFGAYRSGRGPLYPREMS